MNWIGLVQSNEIDEEVEYKKIRYTGASSRNVNAFITGPEDYSGKLSFFPQNWKFLPFALGSNVDAGSPSPYSHTISETNSTAGNYATSGTKLPFLSFTLEDTHSVGIAGSNFVRTVNGCMIDKFEISASDGELVTCDIEYVARNCTFSSGAATALSEDTSRPFKWQDCRVHIPSGTIVQGLKDFAFSVANNLQADHYLNGSVVVEMPIPTTRDYELSLTVNEATDHIKTLYTTYFRGGSTFNVLLEVVDFNKPGSADLFISLSGCVISDMEAPTKMLGDVNENTITIWPESVSAKVSDTTQFYNAW